MLLLSHSGSYVYFRDCEVIYDKSVIHQLESTDKGQLGFQFKILSMRHAAMKCLLKLRTMQYFRKKIVSIGDSRGKT